MNREIYIKINKDFLKEIPPLKIKEEINILDMYDLVFQDIVKSYLEDINYENEDKIILADNEIKKIAHKMIYKNEYIWEIINETIENEIECIRG